MLRQVQNHTSLVQSYANKHSLKTDYRMDGRLGEQLGSGGAIAGEVNGLALPNSRRLSEDVSRRG